MPPAGPANARVALVGEAPGKNEMEKLKPFCGASGIKLDELLWEAGMKRADVFVSNALLCRSEVPDLEGAARYSVEEYMKWLPKENARRKAARKKSGTHEPHELGNPFECCKPRLMRELLYLDANARAAGAPNGLVVMPLGNFALKTLHGVTGIMKWRGSVVVPKL